MEARKIDGQRVTDLNADALAGIQAAHFAAVVNAGDVGVGDAVVQAWLELLHEQIYTGVPYTITGFAR